MVAVFVVRRLRVRSKQAATVSKPKERLDFILSLTHILMFYTLLLASLTWYEKYMSWTFQLTTWLLTSNCYFYIALLYVNNVKSQYFTLKNEAIKSYMSHLFTVIYVINLSLTYYFLLDVYPKLKELGIHRQVVVYMYPGLSVMINIITNFSYTKSLHFLGLGPSVIIVTLYVLIIDIVRSVFKGPMLTETELCTAAWFDPMNLKRKCLIFIIVMTLSFVGLNFILHMAAVFKRYKRKLRAQNVASEIHQ